MGAQESRAGGHGSRNGIGPKEWLKGKQTVTAADLGNDIWVRIERTNRVLEKYGKGDFIANMPVLFAMYYYAVTALMQIPEDPTGLELQRMYRANVENLAEECLIEDEDAADMTASFQDACRSIAEEYMQEKERRGEEFNPFGAIVTASARLAGLDYSDVRVELANALADFAVSYRVK